MSESALITRVLERYAQYADLLAVLEKELAALEREAGDPATQDLMSRVLILDDIADIYACCLVDFRKAPDLNARALAAYERGRGLRRALGEVLGAALPRRADHAKSVQLLPPTTKKGAPRAKPCVVVEVPYYPTIEDMKWASERLAERGWGKPKQEVLLDDASKMAPGREPRLSYGGAVGKGSPARAERGDRP